MLPHKKLYSYFKSLFIYATKRHNKIFIIPNLNGVYFLIIVFILFLISLTYGHSLAFSTTFIFVSLVMTSAHFTNFNLSGLEVVALYPPKDLRANEVGKMKVTIKNKVKKSRFDLFIKIGRHFTSQNICLKKGEIKTFEIAIGPLKRGEYLLERVVIFSSFPFGLFTAWKYWYLEQRFTIFPNYQSVFPSLPVPTESESLGENATRTNLLEGQEFFGHKEYFEGASFRLVDWKAFARGKGVLIKKFVDQNNIKFTLSLNEIKGSLEEQIEILATWIEELDKKDCEYSLIIDEEEFIGSRDTHFKRFCLQKLARYKNKLQVIK